MNIRFKGKIEKFWKYRTASMQYDDISMEIVIIPEMYSKIDKFLKSNGYATDNVLRISDKIKEGV